MIHFLDNPFLVFWIVLFILWFFWGVYSTFKSGISISSDRGKTQRKDLLHPKAEFVYYSIDHDILVLAHAKATKLKDSNIIFIGVL